MNPNVKITISTPSGWHNDTTKVHISIEDVAHSGNFTIKTVQAKVAQNGSWTDITEDMYVEISENTTVYVLVTDQRGKTYEKNPAEQLPINAQATKPSSATAQVTKHIKTDSEGNTVSENSLAEQKKQAMAEASASEKAEESGEKEKSETGKEFYTIQTASEKVFYLIIDRDGEEEMVYFLTEVTENDLLNVTADNSETLPKNSAALESAIPVTEGALPNNNGETEKEEEPAEDGEENTEEPEPEPEKTGENQMATYAILGIVAVAAIGGGYYFKVVRKKKEEFLDEDDDEEDEEEEYEDDGENEGSEDDFFEDDKEE